MPVSVSYTHLDDGVGDERLRGEQSGEQDRGVDREAEEVVTGQYAEGQRDAEGVESEDEASPAVAAEIGHVHVQPREEHDVQESGRTRENDAAVAQHEVEAVGSDHRTCDDQPQQIGDFEFVQQERSREDDDQDQQEFQDRVFERQRQVYVCEEQHGRRLFLQPGLRKGRRSAKPNPKRFGGAFRRIRVSLRHQI